MSLNRRIAVLGAGNLGSALIEGLLKSRAVRAEQLSATVQSENRALELSRRCRIRVTSGGNANAASEAEIVVLAVKPPKMPSLLDDVRDALRKEQILVSLAAAFPLAQMERRLNRPIPTFRAMPNVAMKVCESATAICSNTHVGEAHRQTVERLFRAVGTVVFVEEEMLHAVTGLAGSGPAYVYRMMEAIAAGGREAGLPPEAASALTLQMFLGAARLAHETGTDLATLRTQVITPGGTTAAGLQELDRHGLREALVSAVKAATERSRELTQAD